MQTIQLDADGNTVPPSHDPQNSTCSMCLGAQTARAFTTPTVTLVLVPTTSARVEWIAAPSLAPSIPPHFSYVTGHRLLRLSFDEQSLSACALTPV